MKLTSSAYFLKFVLHYYKYVFNFKSTVLKYVSKY